MIVRDWTSRSPASYVIRPRRLAEIRAVLLHQTGFRWREANPMWARVRAHFAVHRSGLVTQLHPLTARMRYGAGAANLWAVNLELEGNLPLEYRDGEPVYWRPEVYGRHVLERAQVEAARELLAQLAEQVRGLQVGAHRQVELVKSGCCGPDIWREVGQWAVDRGMPELVTRGGRDLPASWRGQVATPALRAYAGPLSL